MKKNIIVILIFSLAVWILVFLEYLNSDCIKFPRTGMVCESDAIIILIVTFLICISLPISYFFKTRKQIDTKKN